VAGDRGHVEPMRSQRLARSSEITLPRTKSVGSLQYSDSEGLAACHAPDHTRKPHHAAGAADSLERCRKLGGFEADLAQGSRTTSAVSSAHH
jgi:hypothetical protein